jgi:thiosulfate/3-mercaptopyruvate sulfurtransferase
MNINRLNNGFTLKILLLMLFSLAAGNAVALELPGPLVDSDWLAKHLDEVKILDVRDDIDSFTRKAVLVRKRFTGDLKLQRAGAHVPGAVLVDYQNIRTDKEIDGNNVRYMLPDKAEFKKLMQSWGINRNDAIVIMSMASSNTEVTLATRLYWQLKYYGHDNVAILDGGVAQWLLEEKPASIEVSQINPGNWRATAERTSLLASSEDVARAIEQVDAQLVDSRNLDFYLGVNKRAYVRKKGHIPGAKIFPNELLTRAEAGALFSDSDDLQQMAEQLGIDTTAAIITYCNSGQLASASWFVFSELLGNDKVKLYDGSMHQWSLEKRPVVRMRME